MKRHSTFVRLQILFAGLALHGMAGQDETLNQQGLTLAALDKMKVDLATSVPKRRAMQGLSRLSTLQLKQGLTLGELD